MDEIGKLGFGFMRLPVVEGDGGKEIDIEQVKHMVDLFMDAGFTYFDTARGYHNGRSEAALREAVVERYPRESFQVATKLPAWLAKNADHARAMFDKSLRETGAGYFDFFLLHNLGEERTRLFDDFGLWDFLHETRLPCWKRCWRRIPRWTSCSCRSITPTGRAKPSNRASATRLRAPTGCLSW